MYFATNITAIKAAIEAAAAAAAAAAHKKAQSPIRTLAEVNRKAYPDATIDANGMAHAPYDGYVYKGEVYNGGEFLPSHGENVGLSALKNTGSYPMKFYVDGEIHTLNVNKKERAIAKEIAKQQANDFDRNVASHVGEHGARGDFELTLVNVFADMDNEIYGPKFTMMFRDNCGNSVVYKGTAFYNVIKHDYNNVEYNPKVKKGETVQVKATAKHWTSYDGRKATYISRPKIIGVKTNPHAVMDICETA